MGPYALCVSHLCSPTAQPQWGDHGGREKEQGQNLPPHPAGQREPQPAPDGARAVLSTPSCGRGATRGSGSGSSFRTLALCFDVGVYEVTRCLIAKGDD